MLIAERKISKLIH